jgi:hypothetical protein
MLDHLWTRLRVIVDQPQMIPEAEQERAILEPKNVFEKNFQIVLVLFRKVFLAPTCVDNQSKGEWKIRAAREKCDFLRHRVF